MRNRKQLVGRAIRGQHDPFAVDGQDGRRAAVGQNSQLFLGFAPQFLLAPDISQMRNRHFAVPDQRCHQQAGTGIGQSREKETKQLFDIGARDVEQGSQRGTNDRQRDDARPGQHSRAHHHRNDVENTQRRFVADVPVSACDQDDESRDPRQEPPALDCRVTHLFNDRSSSTAEPPGY